MPFMKIVKAISEYSISVVLSAIVIYAVLRGLKIQFDKLQYINQRKQHDAALSVRDEIGETVYEVLNDFIEDHRGIRLQVIEFTNTVTSVAYLPFKYMSCTYEVVSYGSKPEAKCIDKLSTSLFSPFLSQLGKEDCVLIDLHDSANLSGIVHDLYQQMSGNYMLTVMLKSEKNKCIGYVSLYTDKEVSTEDKEDLVYIGSKLSALLGVLDK